MKKRTFGFVSVSKQEWCKKSTVTTSEQSRTFAALGEDRADPDEVGN